MLQLVKTPNLSLSHRSSWQIWCEAILSMNVLEQYMKKQWVSPDLLKICTRRSEVIRECYLLLKKVRTI